MKISYKSLKLVVNCGVEISHVWSGVEFKCQFWSNMRFFRLSPRYGKLNFKITWQKWKYIYRRNVAQKKQQKRRGPTEKSMVNIRQDYVCPDS